jgi:ribosomal protein S18 acetylase RimI-like enzyme
MVCPTMRRQGIGKMLVSQLLVQIEFGTRHQGIHWLTEKVVPQVKNCERICLQDFNMPELYIRVLESNEAGIAMYTGLGYTIFDNPGDPPEVRLLKKELTPI